jgi:REP-associated tyrosine transposase
LRRQLEQILCRLGHLSDYRHGSHTTFSIHLPIVWITTYRHKVLRGEVAERGRAIVREEGRQSGVDILQGPIALAHGHVMLSLPPPVTIRRLIQRMQGQSADRLLAAFPQMQKRFWGRHGWARGSCCGSSGTGTDEVIKASMAPQSHDSADVLRSEGEASPSGDTP